MSQVRAILRLDPGLVVGVVACFGRRRRHESGLLSALASPATRLDYLGPVVNIQTSKLQTSNGMEWDSPSS